jgi:perosamine synthetase
MQYQRFDPTGCNFPRPKVPVLPAPSRQTFGNVKTANFKPLGSNANARSFTRGRYALTEAYRLAGIDPNSSLLAPAYHCRTMLDPAIAWVAPLAFTRSSQTHTLFCPHAVGRTHLARERHGRV